MWPIAGAQAALCLTSQATKDKVASISTGNHMLGKSGRAWNVSSEPECTVWRPGVLSRKSVLQLRPGSYLDWKAEAHLEPPSVNDAVFLLCWQHHASQGQGAAWTVSWTSLSRIVLDMLQGPVTQGPLEARGEIRGRSLKSSVAQFPSSLWTHGSWECRDQRETTALTQVRDDDNQHESDDGRDDERG